MQSSASSPKVQVSTCELRPKLIKDDLTRLMFVNVVTNWLRLLQQWIELRQPFIVESLRIDTENLRIDAENLL